MTPIRLKDLGPLDLLMPSPPNTRRRTLDTYLASNGVRVRKVLEIDSMFAALDLVANTDWVSIFPGIMMASDIDRDLFTINVIVEPQPILDLVLIEPMRQPMGLLAETFLKILEDETARISARLAKIPTTTPAGERAIGQMRADSRTDRAMRGGGSWARPDRGRRLKPSIGSATLAQAKTTTEAPAS
jgi:hypothetical protein